MENPAVKLNAMSDFDKLAYDKAKIYAIHDFVNSNFSIKDKGSYPAHPVDTIRGRSGCAISLLLLKKAIFQTLAIAGDYRIGLYVDYSVPFLVFINDDIGGRCYVGTSATYSDFPEGTIPPEGTTAGRTFNDWYNKVNNYTKSQILDELIKAFPMQSFSFLGN